MKQRVVVQVIIKHQDKVLLLRRSQGRPGIIGKFELPGGSIDNDEQPDEALRRHLQNDVCTIEIQPALYDAVSMINRQDGDIQHIFILYVIETSKDLFTISLGRSYDMYEWRSMNVTQGSDLRDSAAYLLAIYNQGSTTTPFEDKNTTSNLYDNHVDVYSDGGSRGNPGFSAAAFVVYNQARELVEQGGEYLGITTNNQAEYHGVRLGLEKAAGLGVDSVAFHIDSMLVVNQLKGIYRIKNRELWPINERIVALIPNFKKVTFTHIPREQNKIADALVNKILDEHETE